MRSISLNDCIHEEHFADFELSRANIFNKSTYISKYKVFFGNTNQSTLFLVGLWETNTLSIAKFDMPLFF